MVCKPVNLLHEAVLKALLTEARLIDLLNKPGGKVVCLCMILKTIRSFEEKDGHYTQMRFDEFFSSQYFCSKNLTFLRC